MKKLICILDPSGCWFEQYCCTALLKVRSPGEVRIACAYIQLPWSFLPKVLQNDMTRYMCALFVLSLVVHHVTFEVVGAINRCTFFVHKQLFLLLGPIGVTLS